MIAISLWVVVLVMFKLASGVEGPTAERGFSFLLSWGGVNLQPVAKAKGVSKEGNALIVLIL